MKGKLNIHYDDEGDVLELRIGDPTPCHMNDLGDGIFERIDKESGEIKGFTIISFKKRGEKLKAIDVLIPTDLEITV